MCAQLSSTLGTLWMVARLEFSRQEYWSGLPGKNTEVGCHFLLQGIFLTQGLNLCLLWPMQEHSLPLSHLGSPLFMWPFSYIRTSVVAQLVKNLPAVWETWVWSLGWEEKLATSVFWPRKVHWVAKSQMWLSLSLLLSPLPLKIQERMKEMVGIFWKRVDCKMLLIVLIFNII